MKAVLGILVAAALLTGCGDARPTAEDPMPTTSTPTIGTPTTNAPSPTSQPTPTDVPTTPPASPSSPGEVIPDDFPLLSGLPDDREAEPGMGRRGPNRTMEPIVPDACGDRAPLPAHTDRLRAAWTNPEDGRERELVTFASVDEAQAYAVRVLDLFHTCPVETTSAESGETRHACVFDSDLGDFAGAASTLYQLHGFRAPGLTTWYVVRVGAAVLLSVTYNEGGAGADPAQQAADQRRRDADALAGVVDAMATLPAPEQPREPAFGPAGFGRITLGLPRTELLAVPGVRITGGNGVCEDFEAPGVTGHLQPGHGVAVLSIRGDAETPAGIHLGSTLARVRVAYPSGTEDAPWLYAPPYRFEFGAEDRAISVMLLLDGQRCGS